MISWLVPMALVPKETSGWRRAFFTALRRLPALPRTAARYFASSRSGYLGATLDHGGRNVLNTTGSFAERSFRSPIRRANARLYIDNSIFISQSVPPPESAVHF